MARYGIDGLVVGDLVFLLDDDKTASDVPNAENYDKIITKEVLLNNVILMCNQGYNINFNTVEVGVGIYGLVYLPGIEGGGSGGDASAANQLRMIEELPMEDLVNNGKMALANGSFLVDETDTGGISIHASTDDIMIFPKVVIKGVQSGQATNLTATVGVIPAALTNGSPRRILSNDGSSVFGTQIETSSSGETLVDQNDLRTITSYNAVTQVDVKLNEAGVIIRAGNYLTFLINPKVGGGNDSVVVEYSLNFKKL